MKNRILLFLLQIIFVTFFFSCKTTEKVTVTEQPKPEVVEPLALVPWTQDSDPLIEPGDPINFYNQFGIDVLIEIPNIVKVLQDGNKYTIDSSKTFFIPIKINTSGKLTKTIRSNRGELIGLVILFDISGEGEYSIELEKNESNYELTFNLLVRDKTFTLEGSKEIIFEGKHYKARLKIHGDGTGFCRLLTNDYAVDRSKSIIKPAEGVGPQLGTKIIKK